MIRRTRNRCPKTEINQEARYQAARALNEKAFQAKERMCKRLAGLSFTEKVKILEKLRDREKAIAAAGLRRKGTRDAEKAVVTENNQ